MLLVSASFLSSAYCETELLRALERGKRGEARVIPVILKPCDWAAAPFANLQVLPSNGKPVTSFHDREAAFQDVAVGIRKVLQELTNPYSASEEDEQAIQLAYQFLRELEGLCLQPRRDPLAVGVTIGLGHIMNEHVNAEEYHRGTLMIDGAPIAWADGITEAQAFRLFQQDIATYFESLASIFKVRLNRNQRVALLSFIYNVGISPEAYPRLVKVVNSGHMDQVPEVMMLYVNPGSAVEAGLRRRRQAEADLWNQPV